MSFSLLLILNLVITAMLNGLVWMVQLVHYPSFKFVGKQESIAFQQHHTRSMSFLVVPLMLAELGLALWLLSWPMTFRLMDYLNYLAFALLLLVWLVTFLKAVPLHRKLSQQSYYKEESIQKLIKTNWTRTIAWSLRLLALTGLMLLYI